MTSKKQTIVLILIILALSIVTHFAFFSRPNETVFDEVHFGKFISGYLNQKYFFDIHPPLGKLAIAAVAKVSGYKVGFDFKEIGEKYPDNSYLWLRILPVIMGTLLPLVIFYLARELKLSLLASFLAALLVIFENAILGQSLFMLLDSTLLLFGFLGLLLYLIARRKKSIWIYTLAVVFLSFSLSIKWTGLSFLALVLVMEIINIVQNLSLRGATYNLQGKCYVATKQSLEIAAPRHSGACNDTIFRFIIFILLPPIIYFSIFALHFAILKKSGEGDAFHSKEFQSTLAENIYANDPKIKKANILAKFFELNAEMYRSNRRISDNHPYASKWYTWPMMARPIYYWNNDDTVAPAKIYLIGNPLVFWGSFMGLIILLLDFIFFGKVRRKKIWPIMVIFAGFILNFIPFALITRPMFLYHYLTALIFAILALALAIDLTKKARQKIIIITLIIIFCLASFLFFSPLTYGLSLPSNSFNLRLWSKNWQ